MTITRLVFAAALAATVSACASAVPTTMGAADPGIKATLDRQATHKCNDTVASALTGAGITAADIRIYSVEVIQRNNGTSLHGVDGWIGLSSKPGSLIVSMNEDCKVRRVYTRSM